MKKKIVALCLVLALALTAIGGATLAYFTDTDTETNTFTVGNVKIDLVEDFKQNSVLLPGSKTENNIKKAVWVENKGANDAYMWIEVWVPAALDDGDDNSPQAPGLGNSLHFNYGATVTETKATFLGSKTIGEQAYNGYVHYVKNDTKKATGEKTVDLLDQVYMDAKVSQCTAVDAEGKRLHDDDCMVLIDAAPEEGKPATHYTGNWDLVINAVGFQADGFTIEEAITEYYGKDVTAHIW